MEKKSEEVLFFSVISAPTEGEDRRMVDAFISLLYVTLQFINTQPVWMQDDKVLACYSTRFYRWLILVSQEKGLSVTLQPASDFNMCKYTRET